MTPRTSRRSAPTTSAACCARRRCCEAREPTRRRRRSTPTSCARSRTTRSATSVAAAAGRRAAQASPTASSAAPRGTWTSSTSSAASPRSTASIARPVPQRERRHRVHARRRCASTARSASRRRSSATRSRSCATVATGADAEADDPVAEHGPLPRRPRRDRTSVYPDLDAVLGRPRRRVRATRCGGSPSSAARYLQLDDTSLAYLNDPTQREHVAASGRRRRAPARALHRAHQRGARRAGPTA